MPLTASAVDHIGVASKLSSNMRTLHWVTKIGSLKNSLRFYELGTQTCRSISDRHQTMI